MLYYVCAYLSLVSLLVQEKGVAEYTTSSGDSFLKESMLTL